MKKILFILFSFISIYSFGQGVPLTAPLVRAASSDTYNLGYDSLFTGGLKILHDTTERNYLLTNTPLVFNTGSWVYTNADSSMWKLDSSRLLVGLPVWVLQWKGIPGSLIGFQQSILNNPNMTQDLSVNNNGHSFDIGGQGYNGYWDLHGDTSFSNFNSGGWLRNKQPFEADLYLNDTASQLHYVLYDSVSTPSNVHIDMQASVDTNGFHVTLNPSKTVSVVTTPLLVDPYARVHILTDSLSAPPNYVGIDNKGIIHKYAAPTSLPTTSGLQWVISNNNNLNQPDTIISTISASAIETRALTLISSFSIGADSITVGALNIKAPTLTSAGHTGLSSYSLRTDGNIISNSTFVGNGLSTTPGGLQVHNMFPISDVSTGIANPINIRQSSHNGSAVVGLNTIKSLLHNFDSINISANADYNSFDHDGNVVLGGGRVFAYGDRVTTATLTGGAIYASNGSLLNSCNGCYAFDGEGTALSKFGGALLIAATTGNGYINLATQSVAPSTPSSSINLYSGVTNKINWVKPDGTSHVVADSADVAYSAGYTLQVGYSSFSTPTTYINAALANKVPSVIDVFIGRPLIWHVEYDTITGGGVLLEGGITAHSGDYFNITVGGPPLFSGAPVIPPNNISVSAYTLALSDAGEVVNQSYSSPNTITVPPQSSVAYPIGTQITVIQQGTGQIQFLAGSGVTINSAYGMLKTQTQYSGATLHKESANTWTLTGQLIN